MNRRINQSSAKCLRGGAVQSVACAALVLALFHSPAVAAPPTPAQTAQARADLRIYYTWINAPWTGDDQPYQHIRDGIEQALSGGQRPSDLLNKYQAALAKVPNDYQAQFAYYYAAYEASIMPGTDDKGIGLQILGNLSTTVIRSPHPHTYNYVRLAFLCDQYNWINPELKAVGLRLTRHDPSDYDVKFYTVSTLAASSVPADRALALMYAQDLTQRYPKKPSAYSLLASVHYQSWLRTRDPKEAAQAVAQYQRYLQLASPSPSFRKQVERNIAQLQRG